jgi:hypothetical protein
MGYPILMIYDVKLMIKHYFGVLWPEHTNAKLQSTGHWAMGFFCPQR